MGSSLEGYFCVDSPVCFNCIHHISALGGSHGVKARGGYRAELTQKPLNNGETSSNFNKEAGSHIVLVRKAPLERGGRRAEVDGDDTVNNLRKQQTIVHIKHCTTTTLGM